MKRLLVLAALAGLAAAGCGGSGDGTTLSQGGSVQNGKSKLTGTVTVARTVDYFLNAANKLDPKYGGKFVDASWAAGFTEPCISYDDGYDDMHDGTTVEVQDATGKTIGAGSLTNGRLHQGLRTGGGLGCDFDFSIPVSSSDFYKVEVSHRGQMLFSKEQLKTQGWKVSLSLGRS